MPLSRVKQREDVFYRLFKEFSTKILEAGETYSKLVHDYPDSAYQISLLKDYEVAGDNCVRSIFTELNTSFITPFDREDIAAIAREMDEVIDNMEGVSARFATVSTRKMIAASSAITARHPTSPSSSPQTAKIRSVWRAGRLVR